MSPSPEGRLSDDQRDALLALIVAEQASLQAQVAAAQVTFAELVAAADLEPPDDEHDPDGTTAYERAQVVSLLESAQRRIAVLDDATRELDAGVYGTCAGCGTAIPIERLLAVPGTDRCVACASGRR